MVGDIWDILVVEENAMLETKMVIQTLSPPKADNLQMFITLPNSLHHLLMAQGEAKVSACGMSSYFLCHPILRFLFLLFLFYVLCLILPTFLCIFIFYFTLETPFFIDWFYSQHSALVSTTTQDTKPEVLLGVQSILTICHPISTES